jgi:hypothetical protein
MVFCNILEREISLSRCEPIKHFKKCLSCEGFIQKQKSRARKRPRKTALKPGLLEENVRL